MTNDDSFGSRLRDARLAKGMTQVDLAEAMGMHALSVSRWEVGSSEPKANVLKAICTALDLDANVLLFGESSFSDVASPAPEAA